jgi:hypothetical protein
LRSLSLVPLFGALQCNPSKNREGGEVLALGGRRFANRHNNQPKVGSDGGGDIVEGAQPRRNVCGGCFGCVWGGELSGKNKQKLKYHEALNGHKTTNENTTTNQKKAAAMEGTTEGRRDEREARGSAISLFFGGAKSN